MPSSDESKRREQQQRRRKQHCGDAAEPAEELQAQIAAADVTYDTEEQNLQRAQQEQANHTVIGTETGTQYYALPSDGRLHPQGSSRIGLDIII